ncbi:iron transport system/ permease component [Synechococcus sp. A15-127]|uniref:FecCD family ABC transporter permease n=1 Tax=Synechococcus sp. A15-127 TaxID=1050624 RepID=UPI001645AF94|nr:iron ABC transporter permease [Synechococcus sp. A15-127]QNI94598.1 iron transport system/ permease component [Synechococcus sp. A15-127]
MYNTAQFRNNPRNIAYFVISILFPIVFLWSLSTGETEIGINEVLNYIFGDSNTSTAQVIIHDIRLPRAIAALLTGCALGLSGAMLQGMLRNPLASPFLLGISSGAGICVVIMLSLNVLSSFIPFGAWAGSILAAVIVFLIAYEKNNISVQRLILSGVAISSVLSSIQSIFLLTFDDTRIQNSLTWLSGTLAGRDWDDIKYTWIPIVSCGCISLLFGKQLNLAFLDSDTSKSLGLSIFRMRIFVGLIATMMTACAVCIAGLVGFVGLVIPHIVRLLCGNNYIHVIPISGFAGGMFVLIADVIARSYLWELPVGIVTSLLGSPFFIYLLQRSHYMRSSNGRS